jgi:hypothetical protein
VVGNSGLLRHYKGLGAVIDSHAAVFRLDDAPVKGKWESGNIDINIGHQQKYQHKH